MNRQHIQFYFPDDFVRARAILLDDVAVGPVAVNLFARFDEGFPDVVTLCHRMGLEGAKRLEVSLA